MALEYEKGGGAEDGIGGVEQGQEVCRGQSAGLHLFEGVEGAGLDGGVGMAEALAGEGGVGDFEEGVSVGVEEETVCAGVGEGVEEGGDGLGEALLAELGGGFAAAMGVGGGEVAE